MNRVCQSIDTPLDVSKGVHVLNFAGVAASLAQHRSVKPMNPQGGLGSPLVAPCAASGRISNGIAHFPLAHNTSCHRAGVVSPIRPSGGPRSFCACGTQIQKRRDATQCGRCSAGTTRKSRREYADTQQSIADEVSRSDTQQSIADEVSRYMLSEEVAELARYMLLPKLPARCRGITQVNPNYVAAQRKK